MLSNECWVFRNTISVWFVVGAAASTSFTIKSINKDYIDDHLNTYLKLVHVICCQTMLGTEKQNNNLFLK